MKNGDVSSFFVCLPGRVSTQFPIPCIWGVEGNPDFAMPPGLICVGSVSSSFLMEVAHLDFSSPAPWLRGKGDGGGFQNLLVNGVVHRI